MTDEAIVKAKYPHCEIIWTSRGETVNEDDRPTSDRLTFLANSDDWGAEKKAMATELLELRHAAARASSPDPAPPEGTYACPICGCETPHAHDEKQIAEWRAQERIENREMSWEQLVGIQCEKIKASVSRIYPLLPVIGLVANAVEGAEKLIAADRTLLSAAVPESYTPTRTECYEAYWKLRGIVVAILRNKGYGPEDSEGNTIALDYKATATTLVPEPPAPASRSLLRPAGARPPDGCCCEPGRCMAPKVMGRQTPCRDPEKAKAPKCDCWKHERQVCDICQVRPDPAREALVGALKDIAEWWETDAPNCIDFPRGQLYAAIALAEQGHKGATNG